MKLTLGRKYSFEMEFLGYQFPALANTPYDSNWLNVRIDVRHPLGEWSAVDPALLTYEVKSLADWLRNLAAGRRDERCMDFMEPCLVFSCISSDDSTEALKIEFSHEFRPPWLNRNQEDEFEMVFPLAKIDLIEAAEALERNLARYPQRTSL